MAKIFKLPKLEKNGFKLKGKELVAGKTFTDGQLLVQNDDDAAKMAPMLVRFYGCTVEAVAEKPAEDGKDDGSLAKSQTKQ